MFYAGIGSRKTPKDILEIMFNIGMDLYKKGYVLRSGGADGADTAFQKGAIQARNEIIKFYQNPYASITYTERMEIFLPWDGFNGWKANQEEYINSQTLETYDKAKDLVKQIHPNVNALTRGAWALHTRNIFQILGADLKTPVSFVICYTDPEYKQGGTRTAAILAKSYNIPIFNLAINKDFKLKEVLQLQEGVSNDKDKK